MLQNRLCDHENILESVDPFFVRVFFVLNIKVFGYEYDNIFRPLFLFSSESHQTKNMDHYDTPVIEISNKDLLPPSS